jgi:hypothetical protein
MFTRARARTHKEFDRSSYFQYVIVFLPSFIFHKEQLLLLYYLIHLILNIFSVTKLI